MQCVILAAGRGTRMRPLSDTCPKPLIPVLGMPIVEHIMRALPEDITEIIFVVGYKGEHIRARFGNSFLGRTVRYVRQKELSGTAHALRRARPFLRDPFLVLCADDLIGAEDLKNGITRAPCVFAAEQHEHPERFGVITAHPDGTLADIVEKPERSSSSLVSTGAMILDTRIFRYVSERHASGEYFLPIMLKKFARKHPLHVIRQTFWVPIGTPEDIAYAENILRKKKSIA